MNLASAGVSARGTAAAPQAPAPSETPAASPEAPVAGTRPTGVRADRWLVAVFVVLLVLTQRIGVPVGGTAVSVALPLTYVFVAVMLVRRRLSVERLRFELLVLALALTLTAGLAVSLRGDGWSTQSLLLLLTIYIPWVLRVAGDHGPDLVRHAGRVFVNVMLVLAVVGIGQLASQLAGLWQYQDHLAEWVPPEMLVPEYNVNIPLVWDSPTYKANAFVGLEPSFLSQYCALALIIGVVLRLGAWRLLVLAAGVGSAVSGTGIVLLAFGGVLLLLRSRRSIRPIHVVTALVAGSLLLFSPVAPLLLDRSDEVSQPGSSGNLRFVAPYSAVSRGLAEEPHRYVIGAGPGNEDVLKRRGDGEAQYANYPVVPKLVIEYGIVAGGFFALFLLVGLLHGTPWRVVPGALVLMTFVLSGALLQPQTASLAWVLSGLGASTRPPDT